MLRILRLGISKFKRIFYCSMLDYVRIRDLRDFSPPAQLPQGKFNIVPFCPELVQSLCLSFPPSIVEDFLPRAATSQGFVAMLEDRAIGYIWATTQLRPLEGEAPFLYSVRPCADQSYLYDLKVAPDAQGGGIGMALMVRGMMWAKQLNKSSMIFTTSVDNRAVHRLTEKLGFKDIGLIRFTRIFHRHKMDLSALERATSLAGVST